MEYELGFKELYDVAIKTTSNIEINGKTLEAGETVVAFDKVTIAGFQEIRKISTANGGFDNRPHVWWETVKDVSFSLNQGVFSKEHFAMMVNAQLFKVSSGTDLILNQRESLETDANGDVTLTYAPMTPIFVYNSNHEKLTYTSQGSVIHTSLPQYSTVYADYYYAYDNGYQWIRIGEEVTHGYFTLEGKTRVKDDITGQVKTGLIRIPKLKLVSDLSMKLGKNATPIMGTLDAVACPVGTKGNTTVMEILFLNDDIDSDM